ncbi:MAG: xanthine dehydrogenase family protein subunit M [Burkholderiaceae bacterium]|nr:xanthine dehydrogenase family protein subunit M [Burkholderiaceae bacterium]
MKLPDFHYASPGTLAEAIALLAAGDSTARLIAGGQSLLPTMAYRLATPSLLVDLRKVPGLDRIEVDERGVRLGATVRWRDIVDDARLAKAHPLLVEAIAHVGHHQIRNRGTVGGGLAHADPAAEMPAIAVACDAQLTLVGPSGSRAIRADEFFLGPLSTALAADEILVEISLPPWPATRRWGFEEFSRRRGDFAIAGIALHYDPDPDGRARNVHVAVFGASQFAHRLPEAEQVIEARIVDASTIKAAAAAAAGAVHPSDDLHASAAYRRSLVATLVERVLERVAT